MRDDPYYQLGLLFAKQSTRAPSVFSRALKQHLSRLCQVCAALDEVHAEGLPIKQEAADLRAVLAEIDALITGTL